MSPLPYRDETEVLQAIERIRDGDRNGFDVIYHVYVDSIRKLCRSRLQWADRCIYSEDDLASEILLDIWISIREKNIGSAKDLWHSILRLAFERCVDRARYNGRSKRTSSLDLAKLFDQLYGCRDIAIGIAEVDAEDMIENFLRKLPDSDSKELIDLKRRGLTNEQIADQRHVDLRTVQRRLKALKLLYFEVKTAVEVQNRR
jgi:DNA-directed RNA polymerase specialized sigma24 family protein